MASGPMIDFKLLILKILRIYWWNQLLNLSLKCAFELLWKLQYKLHKMQKTAVGKFFNALWKINLIFLQFCRFFKNFPAYWFENFIVFIAKGVMDHMCSFWRGFVCCLAWRDHMFMLHNSYCEKFSMNMWALLMVVIRNLEKSI